MQLLRKELQV